jgi:hypothetical protein
LRTWMPAIHAGMTRICFSPSPFPLPRGGGEDKGEEAFGQLPFNFIDSLRSDAFEKAPGRFIVKLRIGCFDAKKKTISRR